jgi:hypothetical protein
MKCWPNDAVGHSRPMHSVPVPINVRCYSNSDIIVRRSEVTLRAIFRLMHCKSQPHAKRLSIWVFLSADRHAFIETCRLIL